MTDRSPSASARAPRTFFVVGSERSGTTVLRLMLDHHPALACVGEVNYVTRYLPPGGGEPDMARLARDLAMDRVFRNHGLAVDPALDLRALAESFLAQLAGGAEVRGGTVHERIEELPRLFPDARFVHLVRDPRDVASSMIGMGWAGNHWSAARHWVESMRAIEALRERVPAERFHELRFEDLVREPVASLTAVARFLGVPYDARMLDYPSSTSYPAPDPSAAERWPKELAPREVQAVEARAGARLERYGYRPSGLAAVAFGPLARLRLRAHCKLMRTVGRWKRYGAGDVLRLAAARRLGLRRLEEQATLRMQEVDNRHLR